MFKHIMGDPFDIIISNNDGEQEDDVPEIFEAEYSNVDSTLDQLASCLDALEEKNDSLYSRLQQLLTDSISTRTEIEDENSKGAPARESSALCGEVKSASPADISPSVAMPTVTETQGAGAVATCNELHFDVNVKLHMSETPDAGNKTDQIYLQKSADVAECVAKDKHEPEKTGERGEENR